MGYLTEQRTAYELLRTSGRPVTVRRQAPGTYDPVADTETGAEVQTFLAYAVLLPLLRGAERDRALAEGRLEVLQLSKLLMSALTTSGTALPFTPEPGDTVAFLQSDAAASDWWRVQSVGPLAPDGLNLLYTLVLSKGSG